MKPLKIALVLLLSISHLSADTTTKTVKCEDVLEACDKAVGALEHEVNVLKDLNQLKADEVNRLRSKEDAWETNKWLWLGAGLIVGLAGGVYLSK